MRGTLAVAILFVLGSQASAQSVFNPNPQIGSPYSQGTLSPYLNLLRSGPANYQLGVVPEFNLRATSLLADYNYRFNLMQSNTSPADSSLFSGNEQLSPTGHPAAFMYYSGYFQVPNVRPFIPFNPGQGQSPQRR